MYYMCMYVCMEQKSASNGAVKCRFNNGVIPVYFLLNF